ncbi:MAG: LysR family transcriptional regulator [Curtobacterium sp.]|jgi:DNA-binding transcriptional LysR family regulator
MDLVAACRVLVEVEERGGVTRAAAALDIAQSVASRRIDALERHLGGPLLERSSRSAVLTPFGKDLVPSARRLVRLADELELDADRARLRPVSIAVPETCTTRDLAVAEATARGAGVRLDLRREPPARRAELAAARTVRVSIVAVPAAGARWRVPLGAAGRRHNDRPLRLEGLRTRRTIRQHDDDHGSRLRIGPEDDVPHVRDVLDRAAEAAGLLPSQLPTDATTTSSLAAVLADGDLLLCSEAESVAYGLHWRPFVGTELARGYAVLAESEHDADAVQRAVADELAVALGVPDVG